jgi:SPP1 gp7 family putative phage head morphogenesis protein
MTEPLSIGLNVPFAQAIKAAAARGVVLPDIYYGVLQGLERQLAFSVAGVASLDQLTQVRDSLTAALQTGASFETWKKGILASGSLDLPRHRLDNIFRTNIQGCYNRGRWERFVAVKDTRPYLMYDAINDSRVRPAHLAMDNIIRPVDDAFWASHAPANGYRCRCRLISLTAEQAQARSGAGTGLNKAVNGVEMEPDKGWDYNPGQDLLAGVNKAIAQRKLTSPPVLVNALDEKLAYWQAGTQQAPWHDASFSDSPDWIKEAIKKHDYDFSGLLPFDKNHGAYHQSSFIHMGAEDIKSNYGQGVWRHEYGHYLDMANSDGITRMRSGLADFSLALKNDTNDILKASGFGRSGKAKDALIVSRTEKYNALRDEIEKLSDADRKAYLSVKAEKIGLSLDDIETFLDAETIRITNAVLRDTKVSFLIEAIASKDAATFMEAVTEIGNYASKNKFLEEGLGGLFSDLIGSATKNKLLGHGPGGGYGHSNAYYKRSGAANTEVFANLTALLGSDSNFWKVSIESLYPTLTKLFKEILQ